MKALELATRANSIKNYSINDSNVCCFIMASGDDQGVESKAFSFRKQGFVCVLFCFVHYFGPFWRYLIISTVRK